MQHSELMRRLRNFARAVSAECEYVNHGGCGVVAGIAGEYLERWGVPVEVITPGDPPKRVRERMLEHWGYVSEEPYDWDSNGLWRSHLALRFMSGGKLFTWDTEGTVRSGRHFGRKIDAFNGTEYYWHQANYPFGEGMAVAECAMISSEREGWNNMFDRDQIPRIEELAVIHLGGDHA